MLKMGYHWDDLNKVYLYRIKGPDKMTYNYDDPNEFSLVIVEEQPVDNQDHYVDSEMEDIIHEEDEVWLHGATYQQNEDSQGWGQWQQNSWT